MTEILIIEDNKDLALGLKNNFEIEGYQVTSATDGLAGLAALEVCTPAIIILDLMMPNMDGFEFLKRIEKLTIKPMILILSARDTEIDKVKGLRLGADDFVTKPFGLMELVARVEALVRRQKKIGDEDSSSRADVFSMEDVTVCLRSRRVLKRGEEVELAPKEFDLLVKLFESRGEVVSRLTLMQKVWGHSAAVESRTIDTHIGELRKKLEADSANPKIIKTVRKIGYRIDN
ncbi:response regulator transcription factor [Aliikangiella coralliicola]|nr:response regulator transcription factor [Aliikangiella coralliicola]